jgi:hypothetical protein
MTPEAGRDQGEQPQGAGAPERERRRADDIRPVGHQEHDPREQNDQDLLADDVGPRGARAGS